MSDRTKGLNALRCDTMITKPWNLHVEQFLISWIVLTSILISLTPRLILSYTKIATRVSCSTFLSTYRCPPSTSGLQRSPALVLLHVVCDHRRSMISTGLHATPTSRSARLRPLTTTYFLRKSISTMIGLGEMEKQKLFMGFPLRASPICKDFPTNLGGGGSPSRQEENRMLDKSFVIIYP